MASYKVILKLSAEDELRSAPFPFRRQINQAIHKLKDQPRIAGSEAIDGEVRRLPVHGFRIVYEIDEQRSAVTIYRITR